MDELGQWDEQLYPKAPLTHSSDLAHLSFYSSGQWHHGSNAHWNP
jgi:hypothetical protein